MKKGSIERGRRGLFFATPQLTHQIRRFIAARFFLYLGAMCSYFIGVQVWAITPLPWGCSICAS